MLSKQNWQFEFHFMSDWHRKREKYLHYDKSDDAADPELFLGGGGKTGQQNKTWWMIQHLSLKLKTNFYVVSI